MKELSFLLVVLLWVNGSSAQPKFQRVYGGSGTFEGQSVVVTSDSSFVIAGHTTSSTTQKSNVLLMKLTSQGNVVWAKTFAVSQNDIVRYLAQTRDNGFVISGYASDQSGNTSPLLIKTNSSGDVQWSKTYSNSLPAYSFCAQELREGGYVIAGYGQSAGNGWDGLVIKTDSSGNIQWQHFYGTAFTDGLDYVNELADGSFLVAGWSYQSQTHDSWLLKIDETGNVAWSRTYGGDLDEDIQAAIPSRSGGFLAAGVTMSYGLGGDILLFKTGNNGELVWAYAYGGYYLERAQASMVENQDGTIVVIGVTASFGPTGNNIFFLRTDSLGSVLNFRVYGGSGEEDGRAVRRTPDGGYIVVGWSQSFKQNSHDIYVIKTDSDGVSGCNDLEESQLVTKTRIMVPTTSHGISTFTQQDTSIQEFELAIIGDTVCTSGSTDRTGIGSTNSVPGKMDVSQNFPNPFNPSTSFDVDVNKTGFVTVLIYNEVGQIVDRLVQSELAPGRHRVNWMPHGVSSGTYFYRLDINGVLSPTQRMILLK